MVKIDVFIEKTAKSFTHQLRVSTAQSLLAELKINPVEVIIVRNNEVILPQGTLKDGDTVKILSVISGG